MTAMPKRVTCIGIGEMGAALAGALISAGHAVTVWNRTASKCTPLAEMGAKVGASVAASITNADVVVVCVSGYDVLVSTVQNPEVSPLLRGKAVVQFTTRTPKEARANEVWAKQSGIGYLEGAIFSYPPSVGTQDNTIVYSGPRKVFDELEPILLAFGGHGMFVGEHIGSSSAMDLSVVGTFVPGAVTAFLQGAALCNAEGAPLDMYFKLVTRHALPTLAIPTMDSSVAMIEKKNYTYVEGGSAPLDVWYPGLLVAVGAMKDAGVQTRFMDLVVDGLRVAVDSGRGQDELPVIYEQFKVSGIAS